MKQIINLFHLKKELIMDYHCGIKIASAQQISPKMKSHAPQSIHSPVIIAFPFAASNMSASTGQQDAASSTHCPQPTHLSSSIKCNGSELCEREALILLKGAINKRLEQAADLTIKFRLEFFFMILNIKSLTK
jgi:hypothetical protein